MNSTRNYSLYGERDYPLGQAKADLKIALFLGWRHVTQRFENLFFIICQFVVIVAC